MRRSKALDAAGLVPEDQGFVTGHPRRSRRWDILDSLPDEGRPGLRLQRGKGQSPKRPVKGLRGREQSLLAGGFFQGP